MDNTKNLTKEEALKLFEEKKVYNYTPEEIFYNKAITKASIGNLKLEGDEIPDWLGVLSMEVARGELDEKYEDPLLIDEQKDRCEEKVKRMAEYGLTWRDL